MTIWMRTWPSQCPTVTSRWTISVLSFPDYCAVNLGRTEGLPVRGRKAEPRDWSRMRQQTLPPITPPPQSKYAFNLPLRHSVKVECVTHPANYLHTTVHIYCIREGATVERQLCSSSHATQPYHLNLNESRIVGQQLKRSASEGLKTQIAVSPSD